MTREHDALFTTDPGLAQRLEQAEAATTSHYVAARARLRPAAGCTTAALGDGTAFYAGAGSPINRVVGLGMAQPVTAETLAACTEFYSARQAAPHIDLCPLAHPSLLTNLLHAGYGVAQFKHVFARTLSSWPDVRAANPEIEVAPVGAAEAALWAQTVAGAFHGGAANDADLEIALPNAEKPDTICFLARLDGAAAGGGALAIAQGVALCYSASVRPEMRRMGVQHALLHARLSYATAQGCELIFVHTTPGSASQRNIARFGFQIIYTKATMVQPRPG